MAKSIKRVVVIFFVLVISCLLIVGCIFASNIIQNNSLDAEDSMQSTSDKSYFLDGTEEEKAVIWNEAVTYSKNNSGVNVNLTLMTWWFADNNGNFGTGAGFSEGRIWIPQGATITLDLNKHPINRRLYGSSDMRDNGGVFLVEGTLNLKDSGYTKSIAKSYLEKYTDTAFHGVVGLIAGGNTTKGAGAIAVCSGGTLNMYGGVIVKNNVNTSNISYSTFGGAIEANGHGTTLNIYGGAIAYNTISGKAGDYLSALMIVEYAIVNLYDILITKNIGGGVGSMGSHNWSIGSGTEIYENTKNGKECNVDRNIVNSMQVIGNLSANGGSGIYDARIGVTTSLNTAFTDSGYSKYNAGVNPARYFFDDSGVGIAVTNASGQVLFSTKTSITKPTRGSSSVYSKTYTGSALTYTPSGFDSTKMTISGNTGTGAKSYNAIVEPKEGYVWSDTKEYGKLVLSWEITPKLLTKPTRGTSSNYSKTYSGKTLSFTPSGFDSKTMDITGNVGTSVGNYSATISLKDTTNYKWSDNTTTSITLAWSINPKVLTKPSVKNGSFEYDGNEQSLELNNFDSNTMNIQNNTGVNANTYNAKISLKDEKNYKWADNTVAEFTLSWKITPKPIEKPTPANSNEFIYNNAEQAYIPNGFDSTQMEITDNVKTAVGEYIAKVKPNSNHKWNDDTTTEIEFNFRILPPGIVVKDGMKYDYQYIDSNNSRQNYGNLYMHKLNDENLNVVNGIARHILGNIPISTTIDTFLNNLQSDRNLIKIYAEEADTTPIYDGLSGARNEINRVLATGFKVELYNDANGQEKLDTIYLSVLGDINGDGRLTASDISYLRQVANNNALLESMPLENQLACMVNNRGGVTSVDCEIIRNVIANEIELEIFFESSIVEENNDYEYLTLNRDNLIRGTSDEQTNVIGNISVNTSVTTFKEKLAVLGIDTTAITIYDRKGIEVSDNNAIVGTGWSIETGGKTIYLSVIGDLNGDGRITATDIANLREIATSDITEIQDCVLLSAILINKGGISNIDSEVLRVVIENKTNLNNY